MSILSRLFMSVFLIFIRKDYTMFSQLLFYDINKGELKRGENMIFAITTLITVGIILFGISFALKDRFQDLEEQIEQLSLTTMQDSYQLKKKMRVLEEELLVDEMSSDLFSYKPEARSTEQKETKPLHTKSKQPPLVERVLHMYKQGYTTKEIANETSLHEHDILTTLREFTTEQTRN